MGWIDLDRVPWSEPPSGPAEDDEVPGLGAAALGAAGVVAASVLVGLVLSRRFGSQGPPSLRPRAGTLWERAQALEPGRPGRSPAARHR